MRNIARVTGLTVATLAIAAAAYAAEFRSKTWGFTTTYPETWIYREFPQELVTVRAIPKDVQLVNCNTTANEEKNTATFKQDELNTLLAKPMGKLEWAQIYSRFTNVDVQRTGNKLHPSGVRVQEAVATYDEALGETVLRVKTWTTLFVTPGVIYSISCNAIIDRYDAYQPDFNKIVESFRPGQPPSVNLMPGSGDRPTKVSLKNDAFALPVSAGSGVGAPATGAAR
jgi:hypothetical protein